MKMEGKSDSLGRRERVATGNQGRRGWESQFVPKIPEKDRNRKQKMLDLGREGKVAVAGYVLVRISEFFSNEVKIVPS